MRIIGGVHIMSDPAGLLSWLGVNVPDLFAGFAGGVVNAFVFKRADPMSILGSVVVGACTANFLSGPIGHYIGVSGGASAFVVGLGGMAICQGIVEAAKSWRPFSNRGGNDAKP